MKKMKRIVSGIAAVVLAASMSAVAAFAVNTYSNPGVGHYWYSATTGYYYETEDDALTDTYNNGGTAHAVSYVGSTSSSIQTNIDYSYTVSSTYRYYCSQTGRYYKNTTDASNDALYNFGYSNPTITDEWSSRSTVDYSTSYSTTYHYYCRETGRYYKTGTDAEKDALYNFGYSNPTIYNVENSYDYSTTYTTTYHYYCTQTGRYYKNTSDASNDALYNFGYSNPTITDMRQSYDYSTTYSTTYHYYCTQTGRYYKTASDAENDARYNYGYLNVNVTDMKKSYDYSYTVSSVYRYYCTQTSRYYRSKNDASNDAYYNFGYSNANIYDAYTDSSSTVSAAYPWYSSYTRKYYRTQNDAIADSNGSYAYVTYAYIESSTYVSSTYPWYSSYTRKYYKTQSDATKASGNQSAYVSYAYVDSSLRASSTYPWFSLITGKYYKSQSDALKVSNNNSAYVQYAIAIPAGTPYVSSNKSYFGWSNIADYLQKSSAGSTVAVTMNGSTTVGSDVLKAIDGKNINVQFVLGNGIMWTVNGTSVNLTDSMNIMSTTTNNVPTSEITPYKKGALSVVRLMLGSDEPLGLEAKITVVYNTNRAGRKAYVYHYDSSEGTLTKVTATKISSNGYCTFKTDEGGAFIIVLK